MIGGLCDRRRYSTGSLRHFRTENEREMRTLTIYYMWTYYKNFYLIDIYIVC